MSSMPRIQALAGSGVNRKIKNDTTPHDGDSWNREPTVSLSPEQML